MAAASLRESGRRDCDVYQGKSKKKVFSLKSLPVFICQHCVNTVVAKCFSNILARSSMRSPAALGHITPHGTAATAEYRAGSRNIYVG